MSDPIVIAALTSGAAAIGSILAFLAALVNLRHLKVVHKKVNGRLTAVQRELIATQKLLADAHAELRALKAGK